MRVELAELVNLHVRETMMRGAMKEKDLDAEERGESNEEEGISPDEANIIKGGAPMDAVRLHC